MKKRLKRTIKNRYNIAKEDVRILKEMISKRSFYSDTKSRFYGRKPKHPKVLMEYIETY